jgi:tyrosyl-tRNA synthetase
MSAYKSEFINILMERGFIHQMTDADGLDAKLAASPQTGYIGFDCTGPSLHIGSLVQIMMLRHFQKCGHNPIALMGGGTTKVGDPSGKDESRKMLSEDDIANNMKSIKTSFERFITFGKKETDAIMVNNEDWLNQLGYISFLRDIGPHFTINRMLTFDSVKLRLEREQPLTFLEFNYMILQAYDFLELSKRHKCILQMGGSDQWGNIVNGMELGRRVDGAQLFGLTSQLITTSDGVKMGKTAKGAVWLNEAQLSSYDYWQYWRNTQDADVIRFLKLFTEISLEEIDKLSKLGGAEINEAKIILANEATKLCRGEEAAKRAQETALNTFSDAASNDTSDLPTLDVGTKELAEGINIVDALCQLGLTKSKKEARRLIEQGGAKINDKPVDGVDYKISGDDFGNPNTIKLSAGKKRHGILKVR